MPEETVGHSKTLVRSILNACSSSRTGLTLVEIADITSLAPSTVHRLLATLEANRSSALILKLVAGKLAFQMGNMRSRDFVAQIRPMIGLSDHTGETVNLNTIG